MFKCFYSCCVDKDGDSIKIEIRNSSLLFNTIDSLRYLSQIQSLSTAGYIYLHWRPMLLFINLLFIFRLLSKIINNNKLSICLSLLIINFPWSTVESWKTNTKTILREWRNTINLEVGDLQPFAFQKWKCWTA